MDVHKPKPWHNWRERELATLRRTPGAAACIPRFEAPVKADAAPQPTLR
ncbi:MAG TPA: hypothetical protein VGL66_15765 [Caulobacteraceae bacterium]|jgi:hypothetical protein